MNKGIKENQPPSMKLGRNRSRAKWRIRGGQPCQQEETRRVGLSGSLGHTGRPQTQGSQMFPEEDFISSFICLSLVVLFCFANSHRQIFRIIESHIKMRQ